MPEKEEFYSKLNDCGISDKDYDHAKKVWEEFNCKIMKDYHDLYLMTDVLILACVMENFREICYKNYGLDPLWNFTSPGLAWQAALEITEVTLELITDPNIYEMVDRGIRGGISTIIHRHAKANNPGLKEYNPDVENNYIPYLDANNLYGWAISKPLPTHDFRFLDDNELNLLKNGKYERPFLVEVDLEYPKELHNSHNDYPLAPERIYPGESKVQKLIPHLGKREKYVVHHVAYIMLLINNI